MSKDNLDPKPWMESVWPEDAVLARTEWNKIAMDNAPIHFEIRFKRSSYISEETRQPAGPEDAPFYWILASSYPDMAEDGSKSRPFLLIVAKSFLYKDSARLLTD